MWIGWPRETAWSTSSRVKDRYLDVQVTQVGRSLSDFFRRLKRRPGQSIRDYMSDFDRALARLHECGCVLPDLASAWVFVDRMELEEGAELNLLARWATSTTSNAPADGHRPVQDCTLQKPWKGNQRPEKNPRRECWDKRPQTAHMAEIPRGPRQQRWRDSEEAVPSRLPSSTTNRLSPTKRRSYRESMRLRGSDPGSLQEMAAEKLQAAKARSYCAGRRRARGIGTRTPAVL